MLNEFQQLNHFLTIRQIPRELNVRAFFSGFYSYSKFGSTWIHTTFCTILLVRYIQVHHQPIAYDAGLQHRLQLLRKDGLFTLRDASYGKRETQILLQHKIDILHNQRDQSSIFSIYDY